MRICPKCSAYYADDSLAFCLVDGTPLIDVKPGSEKWNEGSRVVEEKGNALRKQQRRVKWRRVLFTAMTMLIATMVLCVVTLNGVIHLTKQKENVVAGAVIEATDPVRFGEPIAAPTPDDLSPTPTPTPSPPPSPSPSASPTPTPTPTPTPIPVYKISGRVMDASQPLSGVNLTLQGAKTATTTTDANGNYIFSDLRAGGRFTISPVRLRTSFTPSTRSVSRLSKDESADFFGVVQPDVYKISGRVMNASEPLGGVQIKLEGSKLTPTTTDGNGNYSFGDLRAGGSYTVIPARAKTNFTPRSRSIARLSKDESADFVAVLPRELFKISGQVTESSQPLGGIQIKLAGSKLTSTTTDGNGNYSFGDLRAGGSYTVTPARAETNFTPTSRSFSNLAQDESAHFSGVGTPDSTPIEVCTDDDRARERDALINRYGADWQRSIESEKSRIIAQSIKAQNLPAGVEPNTVEATATLGRINYEVSFLKCTPRLVTARYEWKVSIYVRAVGTRVEVVPRKKTCVRAFAGVWICR